MPLAFEDGLSDEWLPEPASIVQSLKPASRKPSVVASRNDQAERPTTPPHALALDSEAGTVQLSPRKRNAENKKDATPDWKRLVLGQNGGPKKTTDLFSPIGLESMFDRPPARQSRPIVRERGRKASSHLRQRVRSSSVPSSPPLPDRRERRGSSNTSKVKVSNPLRLGSTKSTQAHESFSPIVLGDGVEYEAPSMIEIQDRLRHIDMSGGERRGSRSSDSGVDYRNTSIIIHEPPMDESGEVAEDLGFVTTRRGGLDADDSFMDRSLSLQSPQLPTRPRTPDTNPARPSQGLQIPKQSASPLKLFDNRDTFTNHRLVQRLSQYIAEEDARPEATQEASSPELPRHPSATRPAPSESFGSGMFDENGFLIEVPPHQIDSPDISVHSLHLDMPKPRRALSKNKSGVMSRSIRPSILKRPGSGLLERPSRAASGRIRTPLGEIESTNDRNFSVGEGKRVAASPGKTPFPKRRRTTQPKPPTVLKDDAEVFEPIETQVSQRKSSLAGTKRKDALYDKTTQNADPELLASRTRLNPRTAFHQNRQSSRGKLVPLEEISTNIQNSRPPVAAPSSAIGKREGSVTTADFFNEAKYIMQHLRARANQLQQTTATLRAQVAPVIPQEESMDAEDTMETFSRPASRDGNDELRRSPQQKEPAAEVVARLRQFRESDDVGFDINSSLKSMKISAEQENNQEQEEREQVRIVSDPPGIRLRPSILSGQQVHQHGQKLTEPNVDGQYDSQDSQKQISNHTQRSQHTQNSHSTGSISRPTISPENVTHLIADKIGGMTFDHVNKIWKRRDSASNSDESEPDFGDSQGRDDLEEISDLAVDESHEEKQLSKSKLNSRVSSGEDVALAQHFEFQPPPRIREHDIFASSAMTAMTKDSSVPISSTRATSWVDTIQPNKKSLAAQAQVQTWDFAQLSLDEPTSLLYREPRPFSPIEEEEEEQDGEESSYQAEEVYDVDGASSPPNKRETSLAIVRPSTPDPVPQMLNATFQLSPLADFTMNRNEESLALELDHINRHYPVQSLETSAKYNLATQHLVKKLHDVLPADADDEWQSTRRLNLKKQDLLTIYELEDFCPYVEELAVSENQLAQLNGAPSALRVLDVKDNMLTSLTSWHHLVNLQYLNVSNNAIEDLAGFSSLVHLRELVADNNKVTNLEGVFHLDGLLKLSLRGNAIVQVDFSASMLQRLETLDLGENRLSSIKGVAQLAALHTLCLDSNDLHDFAIAVETECSNLTYLDVSSNQLSSLDIGGIPKLETLVAESNNLAGVKGLCDAQHLTTLMVGRQQGDVEFDIGQAQSVLNLSLSRSNIKVFSPNSALANLRCLDLSHCGIESLGSELGKVLPALQILNLEHNSVRDLASLQECSLLKELNIKHNRISRLRRNVSTLKHLSQSLTTLDCRDNPITMGFYAENTKDEQRALVLQDHTRSSPVEEAKNAMFSLRRSDKQDEQSDKHFIDNLDKETRTRRQVYQLLMFENCKNLQELDGLRISTEQLEEARKLSAKLTKLGVLKVHNEDNDGEGEIH